MRVWGRVYAEDGSYTWQAVETTADGNNDYVYITAFIQAMKLNPNESPFYANIGIPGQQSVQQQVPPDYFMTVMVQNYSQYFAALVLSKLSDVEPTYRVNLTTHQGTAVEAVVPV